MPDVNARGLPSLGDKNLELTRRRKLTRIKQLEASIMATECDIAQKELEIEAKRLDIEANRKLIADITEELKENSNG